MVCNEDKHDLSSQDTTVEVSVIIPLHRDSAQFRLNLQHLCGLRNSCRFEVIVVTDQKTVSALPGVTVIQTNLSFDSGPGVKRDIGFAAASGAILAYLDDDAFPSSDWIDRAVEFFAVHEEFAALGGPGVTPPDSAPLSRLGGAIYESRLGSGPFRNRFRSVGSDPLEVEEWPAFNCFVRRDALLAVGGWDTAIYGGEDTWLCERLRGAGYRIAYDPGLVVYHYRRSLLLPHLRQVANVGERRGSFARLQLRTSTSPYFYLPVLAVLVVVLGLPLMVVICIDSPDIMLLLFPIAGIAWLVFAGLWFGRLGIRAALLPIFIVCHHVAYGFAFGKGWFSATAAGDVKSRRVS